MYAERTSGIKCKMLGRRRVEEEARHWPRRGAAAVATPPSLFAPRTATTAWPAPPRRFQSIAALPIPSEHNTRLPLTASMPLSLHPPWHPCGRDTALPCPLSTPRFLSLKFLRWSLLGHSHCPRADARLTRATDEHHVAHTTTLSRARPPSHSPSTPPVRYSPPCRRPKPSGQLPPASAGVDRLNAPGLPCNWCRRLVGS